MCPCIRSGPTDLSINRQDLQLIMLDNVTGENCGEVAYARGLVDHPLLDVPVVANIAQVCQDAGIYMDPSDVSSSDDNVAVEADDEGSFHGFSPSPPTDSDQPSPPAANFAAVLQASRDAANHLRQLEAAAPGPSTREAPPPLPNPMDSHLNPDGNIVSDDPISPLRTRSGTIRVPRTPTKKRKPPNK